MRVQTPFGADLDELSLDHLRAFFAEALDEGLRWEAKAEASKQQVRKSVSGFANSVLGGFLVLGVAQDKKAGRWSVEGVTLPAEPPLWIGAILRDGGVAPLPRFEVRHWRVDGKSVVMVHIWPVAQPPCLTASGVAYERTTGATVPIADPAALARLFERGARARQRAEQAAANPADWLQARHPVISVAAAAPGLLQQEQSGIFRESFVRSLQNMLGRELWTQPSSFDRHFEYSMGQEHVEAWNYGGGMSDDGYAIRVSRAGAAAVARVYPEIQWGVSTVRASPPTLTDPWNAALKVLRFLGADGPCYVDIRLLERTEDRQSTAYVNRWSTVDGPAENEIATVIRELERARGLPVWEPE